MDKTEMGKELKKLREGNGVSTYKLNKYGFNMSTIKSIEEGRTAYTIDTLIKYCNACGIKKINFE